MIVSKHVLGLPNELFLSYAHHDKHFASSLVETLRHHSVRVWYSQTNILAGQQWHDEIGAALERCDWFAVVLSPAAIELSGLRENWGTPW